MDKRSKYPELKNADWLRSQVAMKPLRQIAEEIGSSYSAIVYVVKKYNLQVPHRTIHRFNPNKSAAVKVGLKKKYPNGRFGKLASNWKDGISKENHLIRTSTIYKEWRKAVFERDSYTCQMCGKKGGWLEVDHIKQFAYYPELRFVLENGRTLCKKCHKTTDSHSRKSPIKLMD